MTLRFLGRRSAPLSLDDAVSRLRDAGVEPVVEDGAPVVTWTDGPSVVTVAARVGELSGWEWSTEPGERVVLVRRTFSTRSLATALVRFYGSKGRYYTSSDERGLAAFSELLEVDDPERSGYPIVDTVVDLFLELTDEVADVDSLSDALRRARYERLWEKAYVEAL
jgi:hypothetical protein